MRAELGNTNTLRLAHNGGTVRPQFGRGAQGLPGPGSAAWAADTAVTVDAVRQAPDGSWIKSLGNRTTRSSFDATEETFWVAISADSGTVEQKALSASYARKWIVDVKGDHGATGDGTTDDSAAFTAAIATAAKHVYVPPGTYIVTALTLNQAGQTLVLSPGATIKTKSGGSATVLTITAANVGIVAMGPNVTIDGNSVGTSAGSTIYVNGAADARIEGLSFQNIAGIAINAQGTRPVIQGNTFVDCGSTAIYVKPPTTGADVESPLVARNTIRASANVSGIQLHANGAAKVVRARVANNDVKLPSASGSHIGIEVYGGSTGGSVMGNTIYGGSLGISIDAGASVAVQGNYVTDAATTGIELAGCGRCAVSGNTVLLTGSSTTGCIQVVNNGTGYNTVTGNSCNNSGTTGRGVYCQGTSGATTTISGNTLTAKKPVLIDAGAGCEVVGNKLVSANSAVVGVELNNCTYVRVADNTVVGMSSAAVNAYSGTMAGLVIGPNVMMGGTPAVELINGWTPGTNGTGSRLIRGNQSPSGMGTITVGASPYTYTNVDQTPQAVYISGGTVSDIAKNSVSIFASTDKTVWLEPGEAIVVTYSSAPTMRRDRK